jgi:peptide/nickel transport system permease protein
MDSLDAVSRDAAAGGGEPTEDSSQIETRGSAGQRAWVRLRRNRGALAAGGFFVVILIMCACAPLYARYVAHLGPNRGDPTGTIKVGSREVDVLSPQGVPTGPTWQGRYLLGADEDGRDVAVRLLYGGRTSLEVGAVATVITMVMAILLGTVAGYSRGVVDTVLGRLFDVIWSYPVVLLGLALGTSLALGGLKVGPLTLSGNSLLIPALIIGFVYIPYVARPIRGQVLTLSQRDFVDAARTAGAGPVRIMASEILPNLTSTILVFAPLILANAILLEAALSYLGAGVQPPNASWGSMMADGIQLIPAALHLTLVPGIALVLTVMSINLFAEGLRDALDPHGTTRWRP